MAVYRGILHKMSGGSGVTGSGSQPTGLMRREFIEIGDKHVKNVVLSNYHDELLVDAVGQEVQFSTIEPFGLTRSHRVVAVRRPNGQVEKSGFFSTVSMIVVTILLYWFLAVIVGGILYFIAAGQAPLVLVAEVVFVFLALWPILSGVRTFRAWGSL